jgi:UDP-glucose-4-epimerase GalE
MHGQAGMPVRASNQVRRAERRTEGGRKALRRITERREDGREIHYYFPEPMAEVSAPAARPGEALPREDEEALLVTGGAGYVAGPVVRRLLQRGRRVVVLDDLSASTGRTLPREAVLVRARVGDRVALREVFARWRITAVFHFAAATRVGESVARPLEYYRRNLVESLALLEQAVAAGCPHFVFSSSAAVYGIPATVPVAEDAPLLPVNPYGETKAAFERALGWAGAAHGLRWVALRYFNAAGAEGSWEPKVPETHLIPNVLLAAAGGPPLQVFGTDYPTPDGTAIRDYVHVADLAEGHLAALRYLEAGGASGAFNLGTGRGYSVAEVVAAVERMVGRPVPRVQAPRRPGDPPVLVADPRRAREVLGWRAVRSELETIVADAWAAWRSSLERISAAAEAASGAAPGGD